MNNIPLGMARTTSEPNLFGIFGAFVNKYLKPQTSHSFLVPQTLQHYQLTCLGYVWESTCFFNENQSWNVWISFGIVFVISYVRRGGYSLIWTLENCQTSKVNDELYAGQCLVKYRIFWRICRAVIYIPFIWVRYYPFIHGLGTRVYRIKEIKLSIPYQVVKL